MSPEITVLIPIYNAEKHLEDCLQSLVNQSFINFIVYLINDGSTDSTLTIVSKYTKMDSRFNLINKLNTGVSSTRKLALDLSDTKYTIFVDSDDIVDFNYLEFLYEKAESANFDITYCDYIVIEEDKSKVKYHGELSINESIRKMLLHQDWAVLWNKLFLTRIYKENNISFPDGVNMWEDLYFNVMFYKHSTSIGYVPHVLYKYIMRGNGLIKSPVKKSRVIDQAIIINKLEEDFVLKKKFNDELSFSKAYAMEMLITNKCFFDPVFWRSNTDIGLISFFKLKVSVKYKILSILIFLRFDFIVKFLLKIK